MTPRQERVSVAMCTFQGADFVAEQLESILSQTRPADEIVISDDASTDSTIGVIEHLIDRTDVPVRLLRNQTTQGYQRNFETAIGACSGDVIFLADQDDIWLPEKLEAMLPALGADAVIAHCDAILTSVDLTRRDETIFDRHPILAEEHTRPRLILQRRTGIPGATMAFRSELREMLFPFGDRWGHDLWIALVGGALGTIRPVRRALMLYRRHSGGAGPSRHLDAGPLGRAVVGLQMGRLSDYRLDLDRWRQLVAHVEGLSIHLPSSDPRRPRLGAALDEYRRRLALAEFRYDIRRRPRRSRLAPVLGRVAAGDYRRYLRTVASPVKDVVL